MYVDYELSRMYQSSHLKTKSMQEKYHIHLNTDRNTVVTDDDMMKFINIVPFCTFACQSVYVELDAKLRKKIMLMAEGLFSISNK